MSYYRKGPMPYYRWEDYQCTNLGHCPRADHHDIIDLPRGAEPFCPACGKPLTPLKAREIVLVSPPSPARLRVGKRPRRLRLLASVTLFLLALTGGIVLSLRRPPECLYLDIPEQVSARVGEPLQIPLTIGPASAANPALTVQGTLPAGVALDVAGKCLFGTPQTAGCSQLVITAQAPSHAGASAPLTILIKPNPARLATLGLRVAAEVEGCVGQALEVPVAVGPYTEPEPILTVVGKLPPGVSLDATGKRLLGIPRNPGSYAVVLKASAPEYAPGWAALCFTIGEAQPSLEARPSAAPVAEAQPSATPAVEAQPSPASAEPYEVVAPSHPDRSRADSPRTRASGRGRRRGLALRNGR